MADGREIRFKINAYTPATIPMSRLAEYMADFAELLGEPASVHFVRLDDGSTVLVQRIDDEALPKVLARVNDVKAGLAPPEAMSASKNINKRLKEDNADGVAMVDDGTEIIPFPGKNQAEPNTIPTFKQRGNLDGVVISLGGRADPVPVQIQAGDIFYRCVISRGRARSLGPYILGPEVRVHGVGRYFERLASFEYDVVEKKRRDQHPVCGENCGQTVDPHRLGRVSLLARAVVRDLVSKLASSWRILGGQLRHPAKECPRQSLV